MTSTQNDKNIQYCPTKPDEPWKYAKFTTTSCWLAWPCSVKFIKKITQKLGLL